MRQYERLKADLRPFERVRSVKQLEEGMVLIDKWACKRTILILTKKEIWLSHKYGIKSKGPGKSWPIETFIKNFPNWIWVPPEERRKYGKPRLETV